MTTSYPEHGHQTCRQLEDDSFWFRHRNRCLLALFRRYPPRGTVYDVGGGNGFVSRALQGAGHDVVLVEPGEVGCANARQLGVERVICGELEDAGIEAGSAGAVGLFDVVEHVEDDRGFLEMAHRALARDGALYLTVPSYQLLWSDLDVEAGHFRRYSHRGLAAVLEAAGFEVAYLSYMFWLLPAPILVGRALPARLGLTRKAGAVTREHRGGTPAIRRVLETSLAWEPAAIARGMRIPVGSSLIAAARPGAHR
jgi:SAM-dependent methyltransferase